MKKERSKLNLDRPQVFVLLTAFVLLAVFILSAASGCQNQELVAKEREQATNEAMSCPLCNDTNNCTTEHCSDKTGYECVIQERVPCCGNSKCEEGEGVNCSDCPVCEGGICRNASYDYTMQKCVYADIIPCCGNSMCEEGEYPECYDCPECQGDLRCHTSDYDYQKRQCVQKPVTPCCGNSICDRGESCKTCKEDCECKEGTTLADFPDFLGNILIVVGDNAKSQDTLTASAIGTWLYTEGIDSEAGIYSMISLPKLDERDMIVLGRPCENKAWEDYQGILCGSDDFFLPDRALIKLVIDNDREIVYVGGFTEEDTKKAAEYLMTGKLTDMEAELDTGSTKATLLK